jgi:NAD+ diphosphatase
VFFTVAAEGLPVGPCVTVEGVVGANTFSGSPLDRAGARRADPEWVSGLLRDPASRVVAVTGEGVLVEDGEPPRLARLALADLRGAPAYLLGIEDDGRALFAVDSLGGAEPGPGDEAAPSPAATLPAGARPLGLRDAGALLSHGESGVVAQATGLVNWHRRHPRCSVCGAATEIAEAGYLRRCPNCGAEHHPRTDPVVIMLVVDGDRALLGRQARWPAGRYSALAGFVEPGEALEEAVAREVREEAGVEIARARYDSSQPWPFPSSLMLGFFADYVSGEPAPQDEELEDVRWFARDELEAIRAGRVDGLGLPPPIAIARRLLDGWLDGTPPPAG